GHAQRGSLWLARHGATGLWHDEPGAEFAANADRSGGAAWILRAAARSGDRAGRLSDAALSGPAADAHAAKLEWYGGPAGAAGPAPRRHAAVPARVGRPQV